MSVRGFAPGAERLPPRYFRTQRSGLGGDLPGRHAKSAACRYRPRSPTGSPRSGWSLHPHQMADGGPRRRTRPAADRAHRRRQDAGGVSADVGGTGRRQASRPAHALRLAAQGAGRGHQAQPAPPVDEMGLPIRIEDRTGDTSATQKKRQRADPPHILLTTPESLALLTSYEDAPRMFAGLQRVVVDEIHALAESQARRSADAGACAAAERCAPACGASGCRPRSKIPPPSRGSSPAIPIPARSSSPIPAPTPDIDMLETDEAPPWSGGGATYAIPAVLEQITAPQDHADLPQHPRAGRDLLSQPLARQ